MPPEMRGFGWGVPVLVGVDHFGSNPQVAQGGSEGGPVVVPRVEAQGEGVGWVRFFAIPNRATTN